MLLASYIGFRLHLTLSYISAGLYKTIISIVEYMHNHPEAAAIHDVKPEKTLADSANPRCLTSFSVRMYKESIQGRMPAIKQTAPSV